MHGTKELGCIISRGQILAKQDEVDLFVPIMLVDPFGRGLVVSRNGQLQCL